MTHDLHAKKLNQLTELFPPKVVSSRSITGTPPEVGNYIDQFGNQSWITAPQEAYEKNTDAFSLMDLDALKEFIPGFVKWALQGSESIIEEDLIHFIASERFHDLAGYLTKTQTKFLYDFALEICDREKCYSIIQEAILVNMINYEDI